MTQRTAAILGLGRTGTAWARALSDAGWSLRVFDPGEATEGAMPKGAGARRMKTISATVRDASWIIVALPQRLELIQKVIQRAEAEAPRDAVVIATARDLELEALQNCLRHPARTVMLRLGESGAVELSLTPRNDEGLRAEVLAFLSQIEGDLELPQPASDAKAGDDAALA